MDAEQAARDAAKAVLAQTNNSPDPVTVHADAPGVRVTVRVTVRPAGPTPCEAAILAALAGATGPWTTARVIEGLRRRGDEFGDTTVKLALARLSRPGGPLVSSRLAPRGYRLRAG
jgi:hypothetical protein